MRYIINNDDSSRTRRAKGVASKNIYKVKVQKLGKHQQNTQN